MFKTELYNFYQGKVELEGPDPKRTLIVQTGIGGMKLVNDAIAKEAAGLTTIGGVVNADANGIVTGQASMGQPTIENPYKDLSEEDLLEGFGTIQ